MSEEPLFPVLRILVEKGVVRSFIAMPAERRRIIARRILTDASIWAIGMGIGQITRGLIRAVLEEAGAR